MVSKALAAEDGILHFELANIPVGNLEKDSVFAGNEIVQLYVFLNTNGQIVFPLLQC